MKSTHRARASQGPSLLLSSFLLLCWGPGFKISFGFNFSHGGFKFYFFVVGRRSSSRRKP
jgi:hypothetical protein